jgi:hypothetical protein
MARLTRWAYTLMAGRGTSRRQLVRGAAAVATASVAGTRLARVSRAGVCGQFDTSQDVELYDGSLAVTREFVDAHQAPVGCIRWDTDLVERYEQPGNVSGRRWCSGTLIAEDLFLTAGYCISNRPFGWDVPRDGGSEFPISRADVATNMHVDFNYQLDSAGNDRSWVSFDVLELVEDSIDDLDYAILRLDGAPGAIFGAARVATTAPDPGSVICIIGHPEGMPKRVDAGTVTDLQDIRISYNDITTRGGSGGSSILSSPDGALVGIHTTGGCDNPAIGANFGLTTAGMMQGSQILRDLAGV